MTVLDFCIDDIGRIDFAKYFVNLKEFNLSKQIIKIKEGIGRHI